MAAVGALLMSSASAETGGHFVTETTGKYKITEDSD